jgi:endonuclease/exonuclease/phosphatase family metal-dependent hydrolase
MPFYQQSLEHLLAKRGATVHDRVCQRLLELKKAFRGERVERGKKRLDLAIPPKQDGHLLLATWNIREFDSEAYGARSDEPLLYLAEIVSRFDLVAVQEVRRSLGALEKLVAILGDGWRYIVTDLVQYRSGGNYERLAYLYDSRNVSFRGLAGELTLAPQKKPDGSYASFRFARDPYVVGFRSGWFKFCLVTVHILWGKGAAEYPARVREIEAVADAVKARAQDKYAWRDHHVLLGDFNIFKTSHKTFKVFKDRGFVVPKALQSLPSNQMKTKHYDQIAFMTQSLGRLIGKRPECGVFDFSSIVYRDQDQAAYAPDFARYVTGTKEEADVYRMWRTHQMSDHFPMWIRLRTDHSVEYLKDFRPKRSAGVAAEEKE